MLLDEVVGRGEHADGAVAFAYVALEAQDADVSVLINEALVIAINRRV
jgi:hypothetical protein